MSDDMIEVPREDIHDWYLAFTTLWSCHHGYEGGCEMCDMRGIEKGIRETADYLDTPVDFLDDVQDQEGGHDD